MNCPECGGPLEYEDSTNLRCLLCGHGWFDQGAADSEYVESLLAQLNDLKAELEELGCTVQISIEKESPNETV